MNRALPINESRMGAVLASIDSSSVRNLVRIAHAAARMRLMRRVGQSEEDWERELPAAPFDMEFFAKVLIDVFTNESAVRAILNGATIEEATGWDV